MVYAENVWAVHAQGVRERMPLTIVHHDREGDRPTVICGECGKPIEAASDGNYQWVMSSPKLGEYSAPNDDYFTHKACRHRFETRRPLPEGST